MLPAGVEGHDKLLDSCHDGLAGVPRGGGRHQELQQLRRPAKLKMLAEVEQDGLQTGTWPAARR